MRKSDDQETFEFLDNLITGLWNVSVNFFLAVGNLLVAIAVSPWSAGDGDERKIK